MKIAILSRNPSFYSTRRLVEACKNRGHKVNCIDATMCYMTMVAKEPTIHYLGKKLPNYDAVIPRIGPSITFYGTAVVRQFEMMGVCTASMVLKPLQDHRISSIVCKF